MKRTCFCCNELAKHKLSMPCLPNITNKSIVQLSNQYPKGLGMGPFSTNYFKLCHGFICLVIVLGKVAFYISSSIEYGLARFAIIYISQFEQLMEAHLIASCIGNTSPHPTFIHA